MCVCVFALYTDNREVIILTLHMNTHWDRTSVYTDVRFDIREHSFAVLRMRVECLQVNYISLSIIPVTRLLLSVVYTVCESAEKILWNMETDQEHDCYGAQRSAQPDNEIIEPADNFEDLSGKDISLPPTREDIRKLLEVDEEKYVDELFLIQGNYNSIQNEGGREDINYEEIKRILTKEFHLYRLQSNQGEPYTNSRGDYLARIRGDRDEQRKRVRKLCRQIKQRLLSDPKVNIAKAHVIASLVIYYGDAEDTPPVAIAQARRLPPGQQTIDQYLSPNISHDQGYATQRDTTEGYGTQRMLPTPSPTPEPH